MSEIAKSNVIVSDVSGDVLGTNHVQVTIRHAAEEAVYVLDAAKDEVANLIGVATKQKKRGRRPKAAVAAAPEPVAEVAA